jgi:hypothetical protein
VERFECAIASAARDEPLWATASQVKAWLLVEVHGSWGRDAVVDSELGPHAPKVWRVAMRQLGIRVIAIRRDLDRRFPHETPGVRLVHVLAGRPGQQPPIARRLVVDDLHHVVAATESIVAGHGPDGSWSRDDDRYVLVCTNGRHDSCCAVQGRPVVRHLRESRWAPNVWECSHIGGDRFAGNVLVLPDSLYFGRCTPESVDRMLTGLDEGRLDLESFRGRSTSTLFEQAAEHFARRELGLVGLDAVTAVRSLGEGRVELGLAEGAPVVVTVRREAVASPTPLTCKGAAGLSYSTYVLESLERSG